MFAGKAVTTATTITRSMHQTMLEGHFRLSLEGSLSGIVIWKRMDPNANLSSSCGEMFQYSHVDIFSTVLGSSWGYNPDTGRSRYTLISDPDSKGYIDLIIRIYPEGKMSHHFDKLKPGDVVEVKGPIQKLRYTPNMKKHIGMVGQESLPCFQIIKAILKNPDDNTKVTLIYANVSPDDILLKKKLDMLAASHPNLKPQVLSSSRGYNPGTGKSRLADMVSSSSAHLQPQSQEPSYTQRQVDEMLKAQRRAMAEQVRALEE
nr:NADH-cytochrome b5 reductase-like protein [Tanacetum cinerariifolium]